MRPTRDSVQTFSYAKSTHIRRGARQIAATLPDPDYRKHCGTPHNTSIIRLVAKSEGPAGLRRLRPPLQDRAAASSSPRSSGQAGKVKVPVLPYGGGVRGGLGFGLEVGGYAVDDFV